jgi:hypothetical protein
MPKPSKSRTCVRSLVARLMISPVGMVRKNDGPRRCSRSSSTARSSYSTFLPAEKIVTRDDTRATEAKTLTTMIAIAATRASAARS